MTIIYASNKVDGLVGVFSNPDFFHEPNKSAAKVITDRENIRDAYADMGVEVEFVSFDKEATPTRSTRAKK
jgi:hypothetical protein